MPKILVVDDMKTMRKVLAKSLHDLGYSDVVEAEDGEAAWKIISEQRVDLVISDWNMPKMRGLDLLKKMRGNSSTKSLPFIMVTAEGDKDSQSIANDKSLNLAGFLNKPFKPEDFKSMVQKALGPMAKAA